MLILARCSGSVTVSSVRTLRNLLGKSCEWFEPSPRVTAAHDGGFLSLEVKKKKKEEKHVKIEVFTWLSKQSLYNGAGLMKASFCSC